MNDRTNNPALVAFRRLSAGQPRSLGDFESGRRADFRVVTAAAALAVDAGRSHTEAQINEALAQWLAGPGALVATDHVALRRCLVDCRLLVRDSYGRQYLRGDGPEGWRDTLAGLAGVDLAAEAAAALFAEATKRAARKAAWERRAAANVDD